MTTELIAVQTDVGKVRDHNEDNCIACPDLGLYVVADGMGGHAAGEVASAIAIEHIPALIKDGQSLVGAVEATHEAILDAGESGRGTPGMGCTVVALLLRSEQYEIAWVGDSRGYLWDGVSLKQLTLDHSFVQELINVGSITEEEALAHPQRNVITQALGAGDREGLKVGRVTGTLRPGQRLLLCTDGLTGEVIDEDIARILGKNLLASITANELIQTANDLGGSDNITVAIVPFEASVNLPMIKSRSVTGPMAAVVPQNVGRSKKKPSLAVVVIAVLLTSSVLAWLMFSGSEDNVAQLPSGGKIYPTTVTPQTVENKPQEPGRGDIEAAINLDERSPPSQMSSPQMGLLDAGENALPGPGEGDIDISIIDEKDPPGEQSPLEEGLRNAGEIGSFESGDGGIGTTRIVDAKVPSNKTSPLEEGIRKSGEIEQTVQSEDIVGRSVVSNEVGPAEMLPVEQNKQDVDEIERFIESQKKATEQDQKAGVSQE